MKNIYPPVSKMDVVKEFWKSTRLYKGSLFLVITGVIIGSVTQVVTPLYYKDFFNALSSGADSESIVPTLISIVFTILWINLTAWIGWRIATFANNYFQNMVMTSLKQRAFDYLIKHSYSFFTNSFTGGLTQRINRYARAYERLTDRVIWNIIPLVVRVVGATLAIWVINQFIAIALFVWVIVFILVNYIFARFKLKYDIARAEADSNTTAALSDSISNHNTIQLFSGFRKESQRFKDVTHEQALITKKSWDLGATVDSAQAALIFAIEFFAFYFAIRYWNDGLIGIGGFVMIQVYLIGLGGQLWDFGRIVRDFYEGFADAKEMVEIIALPHGVKDIPQAKTLKAEHGELELKDVVYGFNQTRTVINGVNLHIKSGQKVALVGPSGAGKSTLVRLLFRLYDVQGGAILIDGQNIKDITQESLHEAISFVPQDPTLFHRTLMENIRYGKKDATDEEVIRAAQLAHCDEFIKELPLGYKTFVGERGIKLSGGERQRVAIARAILKNAPVLVLDEATSSLDSHSESLIQDALEQLMKGKTTIVIAHRLSTIRKMDRIVVLQDGKVIEDGNHDELLIKEGMYQKLWNLQAGGFIYEGDAPPTEPSLT